MLEALNIDVEKMHTFSKFPTRAAAYRLRWPSGSASTATRRQRRRDREGLNTGVDKLCTYNVGNDERHAGAEQRRILLEQSFLAGRRPNNAPRSITSTCQTGSITPTHRAERLLHFA